MWWVILIKYEKKKKMLFTFFFVYFLFHLDFVSLGDWIMKRRVICLWIEIKKTFSSHFFYVAHMNINKKKNSGKNYAGRYGFFFVWGKNAFSTINNNNILIMLITPIITFLIRISEKISHSISDAHFYSELIWIWYEFNVKSFFLYISENCVTSNGYYPSNNMTSQFIYLLFLIIIILFIWVRWVLSSDLSLSWIW